MRNYIALTAFFFIMQLLLSASLGPAPAHADWYRWTDDDGRLHITDDLGSIPDEKRYDLEVFKLTAPAVQPRGRAPVKAAPPEPGRLVSPDDDGESAPELYGGETLEWWKETFAALNRDIGELEAAVEAKKKYVEIFEGGRRFGQTYVLSDIKTYEGYKRELPGDSARLEEMYASREELRRRARISGVPKTLRE